VRYLAFFTTRVCFAAAVLISKVVHSSYGQYIDAERGKQAFNTSISIFKHCCVEDNDLHGRTTKVLAQLWSIHLSLYEKTEQPPSISLKSRLFFSIAHDALWQWREVYAGEPNNGAPSLPPPVITPSPTMIHDASTSADRPPGSSVLSSVRPKPGNNTAQVPDTYDNDVAFSSSTGQPFLSPSDFGDADPTRETMPSVHEEDQLARNIALIPSVAMQFDMLFPDTVMGYADTEQTWLSSMR
jgi:hypothetical protein